MIEVMDKTNGSLLVFFFFVDILYHLTTFLTL